ncbi:MAG TPA: hypothetical protein VGQ50_15055 [Actinomycetota bacterium]|jgi:hypothetical protein|nr:hypothetical protein [Actinomycetota bacterium]
MMRGGRGWLAIMLAALALVGAEAATRLGPATPAAATTGTAPSTTWLCPHGGGPGWTATIEIANPTATTLDARLTSYAQGPVGKPKDVSVPAHGEVLQEVDASTREASTRVDVFGGWAAVGWVVWGGAQEPGLGAEPCTSTPGADWDVVDGVTTQNSHSFLVVMNPFAIDAVIDVTLYLPEEPPVRSNAWTDLTVPAGSAMALPVGSQKVGALGQSIVGAEVTAARGRIAVASSVVRDAGGIRSSLAVPGQASRWVLPITGGAGGATLSLLVTNDTGVRFTADVLARGVDASPVGDLTDVRQGGSSTMSAQIPTDGGSAVLVQSEDGTVAAGLRAAGHGGDDAATGGAATDAPAWLVLPTAFGQKPQPSMVLVNDGTTKVLATVTLIHEGGGGLGDTVQVTIPAGQTAAVPPTFLAKDHTAAALVQATGPIVALGAGTAGSGRYAMALGVPLPAGALPDGP